MSILISNSYFSRNFSDLGAVKFFFEKNLADWQWFLNYRDKSFAANSVEVLSIFFEDVEKIIFDRETSLVSDSDAAFIGLMSDLISTFYQQGFFFSCDAKFYFLKKLVDSGSPLVAACITCMWVDKGFNGGVSAAVLSEASAYKVIYDLNISGRQSAEVEKIANVIEMVEDCLSRSDAKLANFESLYSEYNNFLMRKVSENDASLARDREKYSDEFVSIFDGAKDALQGIRTSFEADMNLSAPVRFWEEKRRSHRKLALLFSALAIVAMFFTYILISREVDSIRIGFESAGSKILKGMAATSKNVSSSVSSNDMLGQIGPIWHFDFALLILMLLLCFWVLRILVRLFLSQIHLENDAAERCAMIKTYIAMYRRRKMGNGDHEQLTLILSSLFRQAGDGIVKDDSIPPSLMDFMTRVHGQK